MSDERETRGTGSLKRICSAVFASECLMAITAPCGHTVPIEHDQCQCYLITRDGEGFCNHARHMIAMELYCADCETLIQSPGSLDRLVRRLATRGLLPCEHNLQIWQHADNSGWGAAVETDLT